MLISGEISLCSDAGGRGARRLGMLLVPARLMAILVKALAQDPDWPRSLGELVSAALAHSPDPAADRAEFSAVQEEIAAARGERLPRLDAVGLGEFYPMLDRNAHAVLSAVGDGPVPTAESAASTGSGGS